MCIDTCVISIMMSMRTTLTLDPDVASKARKGAAKLGKSFKEIINLALRIGLEAVLTPTPRPYPPRHVPLGLRQGLSYDNINELLARAEGEDIRDPGRYEHSSLRGRQSLHTTVLRESGGIHN